jgi:ACS family hexuronate transporter-like MFS transporter
MKLALNKAPFGTGPKIYVGCVGVLYLWLLLAVQAKRLHDLEKSSNYLWLNFIPGIGSIIVLLIAGFGKNSDQPNKHGETTIRSILAYKQTWAFFAGKFFTDGIWWFYLTWLPDYLMSQFNLGLSGIKGPVVIILSISIIGSIIGGTIPLYFINKGFKVYKVRMTSMAIFAIFPLSILSIQYFGDAAHFGNHAILLVVTIISIAASAHQAWSTNLFTTISDMFPKKAIASITGIGAMAGGLGGVIIQLLCGSLRDSFVGHSQTVYLILFSTCGSLYIVAWAIMKLLVPQHRPVTDL